MWRGLLWAPERYLLCVSNSQKHQEPVRGEEETEDEEEEEEDLSSSSSSDSYDSDEEVEKARLGRGRGRQSPARQAQLEWDDSTLPY